MRWKHFLAGIAVGTLVLAALPVSAANGDYLVLGERNGAQKGTILRTGGVRTLKLFNNTPGGVPLELVAQPGQPPMAVNSSELIVGLNADGVDGLNADAITHVALCSDGAWNKGDGEYVCYLSIPAPLPGYIALSGSIELARNNPGSTTVSCQFRQGISTLNGSLRTVTLDSTDGTAQANCSTNAGLVVAEAGVYDLEFAVTGIGTGDDPNVISTGLHGFGIYSALGSRVTLGG